MKKSPLAPPDLYIFSQSKKTKNKEPREKQLPTSKGGPMERKKAGCFFGREKTQQGVEMEIMAMFFEEECLKFVKLPSIMGKDTFL